MLLPSRKLARARQGVPYRSGRNCCGRCSRSWSGFTIIWPISGFLADATTLKVGQAEGKLLAERAKQINGKLTGSRFLRGILTPGGLRQDIELPAWFERDLNALRAEAEWYVHQLLETNSFRDRLITTGHLNVRTAYDQGATGPIARASGIDRELRRDHPYAGYAGLTVAVPVRQEGDADARFQIRVAELFASFDTITALSRALEPGPVAASCEPAPFTEGLGWAESPRGALFYAVHLDGAGRFERVKIKSPSFSNWRVFPFTVHEFEHDGLRDQRGKFWPLHRRLRSLGEQNAILDFVRPSARQRLHPMGCSRRR